MCTGKYFPLPPGYAWHSGPDPLCPPFFFEKGRAGVGKGQFLSIISIEWKIFSLYHINSKSAKLELFQGWSMSEDGIITNLDQEAIHIVLSSLKRFALHLSIIFSLHIINFLNQHENILVILHLAVPSAFPVDIYEINNIFCVLLHTSILTRGFSQQITNMTLLRHIYFF